MTRTETCEAWVVYRMTCKGLPHGGNVVCEQRQWDAMEQAQPGLQLLVRSGIKTEQEAEILARGTAGDNIPRSGGRKVKPKHSPDVIPPAAKTT